MRAVLQRVSRASVAVGAEVVGAVEGGLVVLLAAQKGDTSAEAAWMARKISELRVFADDAGRMNRSVVECGGAVLLISQFTLAADCRKGRRPSFDAAALPDDARPLIAEVRRLLEAAGLRVAEGRFGEHMAVELVNDGPVTFVLERGAAESREAPGPAAGESSNRA